MRRARAQSSLGAEAGFTLVEILVAITILLVGVLGVMTMVTYANRASSTTGGRQNATNLLRRVIETGRAVPYRTLKGTGLPGILQAQAPDLADSTPSDPAWTVQRGGFTYTLTASVCLVDDPADGYGVHDASDPGWCSDSTQTGTADGQSHDYKRLSVTATWTVSGQNKTMTQAGLVPANGQGDLPSAGQPVPSTTSVITAATSVSFTASTTNAPATVLWLVDGQTRASCPPTTSTCSVSGSSSNFTWNLGTPVLDTNTTSLNYNKCIPGPYVYDGTHLISARGYTSGGLTGESSVVPVTLNRCPPLAPPNFNATGRDNGGPNWVDVEWSKNQEDDVIGYRVYKGTSMNSSTPVCPATTTAPPIKTTSCVDTSPPAYSNSTPFYYAVQGIDRDTSGAQRAGAFSYLNVNTGNKPPRAPASPSATLNADGSVTVRWNVPTSPLDQDTGDTISSFRIYRRAATTPPALDPTKRLDYDAIDSYCTSTAPGAACSYTDTNTGGTQHTYNITSVDTHLRESAFTADVVR